MRISIYHNQIEEDILNQVSELYKEWTGIYPKQLPPNLIIAFEEKTNKVIGCMILSTHYDPIWDRRWGLVENVFVSEDYRRQGVARQLMRHLENQAKLFGCKFLKLTTNKEEGTGLYRALGYDEGLSFGKDLE